ncbi:MAG TPA: hypothetical protein VEI97_16510 [bacterium]|nr:hypothetical protein [bacterium]
MSHPQDHPGHNTVICTYRVKPGNEEAFVKLLEKHWPALRSLGLATDQPPVIYQGLDREEKPYFVEIFQWADDQAPGIAHQSPEVMAIWEPMGALVEERGGRPPMEFPHVTPVQVNYS